MDLKKLRFQVILTADSQEKGVHMGQTRPRAGRWKLTENYPDSDFFKGGRHRKYGGDITYRQLEALLSQTGMFANDVETMGSLGGPTFPGVVPAVSFTTEVSYPWDILYEAYITPYDPLARNWGFDRFDEMRVELLKKWGL